MTTPTPQLKIFGTTLTYDPKKHVIKKPNGEVLKTYPGHSPSDLKTFAERQPFSEDCRDMLIKFAERCNQFNIETAKKRYATK